MKRLAIAIGVALLATVQAKADEKKFYLNRDGTVEQRLDTVSTEVEKLRGDVDRLNSELAKLKGDGKVATKPAAKDDRVDVITYQICTNGKCQTFQVYDRAQVPIGAQNITTWTVPKSEAMMVGAYARDNTFGTSNCPTGPCGDNCQCAGATAASSGSRVGWFPGKRLFGRCCGQ